MHLNDVRCSEMARRSEDGNSSDTETKGTISFSIRLSDKQRDLLAKAADAKGWTVTNLIKIAALERAAFIINTASPNRVDFAGIARQVADGVFTPRSARVPDHGTGDPVDADVVESFADVPDLPAFVYPVEVSPWHKPAAFASELREAARYGGTEFLNLIIDASEAIASRTQPSLPDPIDPTEL